MEAALDQAKLAVSADEVPPFLYLARNNNNCLEELGGPRGLFEDSQAFQTATIGPQSNSYLPDQELVKKNSRR